MSLISRLILERFVMKEFNEGNTNNTEEVHRIKLTRHLWEDEVIYRKQQSKIQRLKFLVAIFLVLGILLGWIFGTFVPLIQKQSYGGATTSEKLNSIMEIMENEWLFGKDIENIQERLENQAIYGITTNEEDPHTEYMSREEVEEFTQSINRNFVGIGVEYATLEEFNIITRVFRDSPAEKAGVQGGDIITKIDGVDATGMDSEEIKERVTGEEGTEVVISVSRQGKDIDIPITRGEVSAIAYGQVINDSIGYINLYQFGESSANEITKFLDEFESKNITNLVIDLRSNGGGYITSLVDVASIFVEKGNVVIQEEDRSGTTEQHTATGKNYRKEFGPIVILTSGDTASAAEAFTIAMKELRDDVTVIGKTTYGKGTVQIQNTFSDGSSLKYTTAKWLSPNGVWINKIGIEPDIDVDDPEAISSIRTQSDEFEQYKEDEVGLAVQQAQLCLEYLGYTIDRTDGYFSKNTKEVITEFQKEYSLEADGVLTDKTYKAIISATMLDWYTSSDNDVQLQRALEVFNG